MPPPPPPKAEEPIFIRSPALSPPLIPSGEIEATNIGLPEKDEANTTIEDLTFSFNFRAMLLRSSIVTSSSTLSTITFSEPNLLDLAAKPETDSRALADL